MRLHNLLNKYCLHTFSPDVNITDEEAVRIEADLANIREIMKRGYEDNLKRYNEAQLELDIK